MVAKRIIAQSGHLQRNCPFCFGKLERIEILKRHLRKKCKCGHCGRVIDERFIIR